MRNRIMYYVRSQYSPNPYPNGCGIGMDNVDLGYLFIFPSHQFDKHYFFNKKQLKNFIYNLSNKKMDQKKLNFVLNNIDKYLSSDYNLTYEYTINNIHFRTSFAYKFGFTNNYKKIEKELNDNVFKQMTVLNNYYLNNVWKTLEEI